MNQHLVYLGVIPAFVHAFATLTFAFEAELSIVILIAAMIASALVGGFLFRQGYHPVVPVVVSGWPTVLASWQRLHWAMNMPSPGGSAQSIARSFGWNDAPVPAAVAAVLAASGLAGWLFMLFECWYKKKMGHSIFYQESDE